VSHPRAAAAPASTPLTRGKLLVEIRALRATVDRLERLVLGVAAPAPAPMAMHSELPGPGFSRSGRPQLEPRGATPSRRPRARRAAPAAPAADCACEYLGVECTHGGAT
jgi:hypothetical protein